MTPSLLSSLSSAFLDPWVELAFAFLSPLEDRSYLVVHVGIKLQDVQIWRQ